MKERRVTRNIRTLTIFYRVGERDSKNKIAVSEDTAKHVTTSIKSEYSIADCFSTLTNELGERHYLISSWHISERKYSLSEKDFVKYGQCELLTDEHLSLEEEQ